MQVHNLGGLVLFGRTAFVHLVINLYFLSSTRTRPYYTRVDLFVWVDQQCTLFYDVMSPIDNIARVHILIFLSTLCRTPFTKVVMVYNKMNWSIAIEITIVWRAWYRVYTMYLQKNVEFIHSASTRHQNVQFPCITWPAMTASWPLHSAIGYTRVAFDGDAIMVFSVY